MKYWERDYLRALEARAAAEDRDALYLWPRTPVNDIQLEILTRVGASDWDDHFRFSRPAQIASMLGVLQRSDRLHRDFAILDVACGDALVLWQLGKSFSEARRFGLDCNVGLFSTHEMVERSGVSLHSAYLQHLFRSDPEARFDVVMMLNTYRGWESADLPASDRDLPTLADRWFLRNARYAVVTASPGQVARLQSLGFKMLVRGLGEDESILALFQAEL